MKLTEQDFQEVADAIDAMVSKLHRKLEGADLTQEALIAADVFVFMHGTCLIRTALHNLLTRGGMTEQETSELVARRNATVSQDGWQIDMRFGRLAIPFLVGAAMNPLDGMRWAPIAKGPEGEV